MGKKIKNKSRGSLGPWLNFGFVEYLWRDVWEVFGSDGLFDLLAMHSGRDFLEAVGDFHIQIYLSISPI